MFSVAQNKLFDNKQKIRQTKLNHFRGEAQIEQAVSITILIAHVRIEIMTKFITTFNKTNKESNLK